MNISYLMAYGSYLLGGLVMLALFMAIYERVTPYRELQLIREGNVAAALTFGGAVLGFSLALVSSALHTSSLGQYLAWGALAGAVQMVTFFVCAAVLRDFKRHIEQDNRAAGLAMMFAAIATGAVNAACMS